MRGFVGAAVVGVGVFFAASAGAQQQQQQQGTPYATQPVYTQPPPPNGQGQGQGQGEYVAPVQGQPQQQTVYVQQQPAMMGPREITSWEEGDPIPPGYHPDTRARKGLIIGGAVTFGVFYLISALVGAVALDCQSTFSNSSCGGLGVLLIPAAGPFIAIGTAKADGGGAAILVIDGLAQAGGLAMLILGIALPKTVLVRNDIGSNRKEVVGTIEPLIGGMQNGLKITF